MRGAGERFGGEVDELDESYTGIGFPVPAAMAARRHPKPGQVPFQLVDVWAARNGSIGCPKPVSASGASGKSYFRFQRYPAVRAGFGHDTHRAEEPVDPSSIKEWAGALAPYIAFFTAFWAILTYRRSKKVEVARLQKQIFDDLHLSGKFDRVREALDFDYSSRVEPALDRAMNPAGVAIPKEDRSLLLDLDNFLNLIEYVLFLEQDTRLLTSADRLALLSYWLGWMRKPERRRLRDYIEKFDYERLSKCLGREEKS
jgi:hypothetical protein